MTQTAQPQTTEPDPPHGEADQGNDELSMSDGALADWSRCEVPHLLGQYRPVHDEIDADRLEVIGELPPALVGTYVRNGPNPLLAPSGAYHLFDGDAMLHGVRLDGSGAAYRNRWVRSKGMLAEAEAGRPLFSGLAGFELPPADVVANVGMMKNTANTHVISHAGRMLALMEASPPTEIDPDSFATLGEFSFGGALSGPMTAHPKVDPATGNLCFFGYSPVPPYLRYHVASPDGTLLSTTEIELPRPVMMHDFVITERHAVFFDLPAVFDLTALMEGRPFTRWEPELGARVGVMNLDGTGDVAWMEHPALELVAPRSLALVCVAHVDGDEATGRLLEAIADDPRYLCTRTVVAGRVAVRVAVGSPRTTRATIEEFWAFLVAAAA
jgi:carotenoid cleavage dioxygenase-like enzyme